MNHYETLGIERNASADEVKKAYRTKASAAHPDRGGDAAEMQRVNQANDVLSDPERRERYDQTGNDATMPSVEDEARTFLLHVLGIALDDSIDVLAKARELVREHRSGLVDHLAKLSAQVAKLKRHSGKVRAKKGDNLVQMIIDQRLQQLDAAKEQASRGVAVNAEAAKLLANLESDPPVVVPPVNHGAMYSQQQASSLAGLFGFNIFGGTDATR